MAGHEASLPEQFPSIEAAQAFWDSHSSADFWDGMEDVEMRLSPALQAQLEAKKLCRLLGLSEQQAAAVRQEAQRLRTDARRLISQWVLQGIQNILPASR